MREELLLLLSEIETVNQVAILGYTIIILGVAIMWFIWVMWGVVVVALISTIILLTGKGSMLVTGFNTKSPEERAKYDKKR